MKQIIIATLVMLMATSALAILDSAPNTIGIYLDMSAEETAVPGLVDGMTDFTFYMILTNPTFGIMEGFVAGYHFEGVAGVTDYELANDLAYENGFLGEHIVFYEEPIPTSSSMLLMTLSATYFDFEYGPALLKLHSIPLAKNLNVPTAYFNGGESQDLHLSYVEGVTIRINAGSNPVATEDMSFGDIKSLYR